MALPGSANYMTKKISNVLKRDTAETLLIRDANEAMLAPNIILSVGAVLFSCAK